MMPRGRRATWSYVALLLAIALPTTAHHSFAMFDREHPIEVRGTVREFQWTNPHVWIQVLVADAGGASREWGIECTSVNALKRQGWTHASLKAGDEVRLSIFPLRDGSRGGQLHDELELNGGPAQLPGYR